MQVLLRSVMNDTLWASTRSKHYLHERRSFVDLFNLHRGKKNCVPIKDQSHETTKSKFSPAEHTLITPTLPYSQKVQVRRAVSVICGPKVTLVSLRLCDQFNNAVPQLFKPRVHSNSMCL